eukprot:274028_1
MATKQRLSSIELKDLESKFAATLVVSSLLSKRGIPCTISNLSKQVSQMCNNQSLTLTDLQMIHHIVPSICYIQSVQPNQTHNDQSHDQNASYQLKFCVPITPNNISKLVNKFTNALSNMQRTESKKRKRNATHENDDNLGPPHKKKRNLHHIDNTNNSHQTQTDGSTDVIEFNLKPLPPSSTFRTAKQLKTLQFEALSFIEQSKKFTFWSHGSVVSSKLLPQKAPQCAALTLAEDCHNTNDTEPPTSIRIRQIPAVLISTYKDIQHMDIMHGLYTHQANAIQSICRGHHNIIATSTSSGKSLIYNIAVLSHIIQHNSQNLYLFPTKALAQDQLRSLNKICLDPNINISCATYDGDTPYDIRRDILSNASIILTNPDMIHQTLLPAHSKYKSLFSNLSFVVIDESHYYCSIFGCHFANIIRRLKRICALYGSHPLFIGCSATINNPLQHFSYLTGIKSCHIHVVDHTQDSSGRGPKQFVFWQPPLKKGVHRQSKKSKKSGTNKQFHIENHLETIRKAKDDSASRRSAFVESALLFSQCIMSELRCILFVKQRSVCELVYKYARDILFKSDVNGQNYMNKIQSYRGGYNKALRRKIESGLFNQELLGIVSTNALELGIDIGDLDCTLHVGYSGLSSLWQQSGRSGRSGKASLAIFIAQNCVIDQYIIHHHQMLFDSHFENTIIYPYNKRILASHLLCAIADEPITNEQIFQFWDRLDEVYDQSVLTQLQHHEFIHGVLKELVGEQKVFYDTEAKKWFVSPKHLAHLAHELYQNEVANFGHHVHPARRIGIRNIDPIRYSVHVEGTHEKIDEMGQHNAFFHVFPGAIYLNQGKEYMITNLDITNYKAYCKPITQSKYYTLSRDRTDILIANTLFTSHQYAQLLHFGNVVVRTSVFAFYKLSKMNSQIMDEKQLKLPHLVHNTVALWIDIPEQITNEMNKKQIDIIAAIHAIEHCMIGLIPLFIKCDSNQFDTECPSPFDTKKRMPRIIICEKTVNGLGYAQDLVMANNGTMIQQLIHKTMQRLSNCLCSSGTDDDDGTDGCLSCCHSTACHEYNIVTSRRNALILLQMLQTNIFNSD